MLRFDFFPPNIRMCLIPQRLESKVNNCQWSFYSSLMLQVSVTHWEKCKQGQDHLGIPIVPLIKINTFKAYRKLSQGQSSESIFLPLNEETACPWIRAVDSTESTSVSSTPIQLLPGKDYKEGTVHIVNIPLSMTLNRLYHPQDL